MARDPYKFFRVEARELIEALSQGLIEIEKGAAPATVVVRLLRLAHTLKGAARVVRQTGIAEGAHAIEGALAPYREGSAPLPRKRISEMLRSLDTIAASVRKLETPPAPEDLPSPTLSTSGADSRESIRVEPVDVDALRETLAEVQIQVSGLRREMGALRRIGRRVDRGGIQSGRPAGIGSEERSPVHPTARTAAVGEDVASTLAAVSRNLSEGLDHIEKELAQAQDASSRLRLQPASTLFPSLERAVRDAAETLRRRVDFTAAGGDIRLDAPVLEAVRDALLHAVRNSVAHGIEPETDRVAAGKPPRGRVTIEVERRGARIRFTCRDDGRGIDVEAIRRAAVERGLIPPAEAGGLDLDAAVTLILRGGVTTSRDVTALSGRAVGLDVVRDRLSRIRGGVSIRSERGRGTSVDLDVPVTLSVSAALLAESRGLVVLFPLDAVAGVRLLHARDIARSPNGDLAPFDGRQVPFALLSRILGQPGDERRNGKSCPVVFVRQGGACAAIGVDRMRGIAQALMHPLPPHADMDPVVVGVSLDVDGAPRLVIDPAKLVETAGRPPAAPAEAAAAGRRPILVIDDSLTTRMLEQSILESAGFDVDLATSGEEALTQAGRRSYGLFIVDVEMPGLNGFEFIERTQQDPALRNVPSVLVTSRDSPEDRARGLRSGARAYMVKSEFDQEHLLQVIRDLLSA